MEKLKNDEKDEEAASFLLTLCTLYPKIRKNLPENSLYEMWSAFKNYEKTDWKIFALKSNEIEFDYILKDLINETKVGHIFIIESIIVLFFYR